MASAMRCLWRVFGFSVVTAAVFSQSSVASESGLPAGDVTPMAGPVTSCGDGMFWCSGIRAFQKRHSRSLRHMPKFPASVTTLYLSGYPTIPRALNSVFTNLTKTCRLRMSVTNISRPPGNAVTGMDITILVLSSSDLSRQAPRALTGTNITTLVLSSTDTFWLSPTAFTGTDVRVVFLSSDDCSRLPPCVFAGTNLSTLDLSSNNISHLPMSPFPEMTIRTLDLSCNNLSWLPPKVFVGTSIDILDLSFNNIAWLSRNEFTGTNIKTVDLSVNNLSWLPENGFIGSNIRILKLSSNYISQLTTDMFKGTNIRHLDLSDNSISSLQSNMFKDTNISTLNLTLNHIVWLPDNAFTGSRMRKVDLSSNSISQLPKNAFANTSIRFLDMSSNEISQLQRNVFAGTSIGTLDLSFNNISWLPKDVFEGTEDLRVLDLTANDHLELKTLREMFSIPRLKSVLLLYCDLSPPPAGFFHHISSHIENITLDYNLHPGVYLLNAFCDLRSLQNLHLRHCLLQQVVSFCPLNRLVSLDLTGNSLEFMPFTCRSNSNESVFPALSVLVLKQNKIRLLLAQHVCLPSLEYLDLSYNSIFLFSSFLFSNFRYPLLKKLSVDHQLAESKSRYSLTRAVAHNAFHNDNLEELDLSYNDLNFAEHVSKHAFANCRGLRYLNLSSNNFTLVDDQRFFELFGHLHSLAHLSMSASKVEQIFSKTFANFGNLTSLRLNNNRIAGMPDGAFDALYRLHSLFLDSNFINAITEHSFGEHLRERLSSLTLGFNPFHCSCDLRWFSRWYQTVQSDLFKDDAFPNSYECQNLAGTQLVNFAMADQACLLSHETNVVLIQFCSVFILTLMLACLVFRYRWHIRLVMFEVLRGRDMRRRQRLLGNNFDYDIFVSYASDDLPWVRQQLMTKLEDDVGLRLCVHQRDFIPGTHIVDNIVHSVERSKKILVVFSTHFVHSQWCQFELALCLSHVLDYDDALIVVRLDDVTLRQMTSAMRAVVKTTTYIQWREEEDAVASFWGRLCLGLHEILPRDDRHV